MSEIIDPVDKLKAARHAHTEGKKAFSKGKTYCDNPYLITRNGYYLWSQWRDGWSCARIEKLQEIN